RRRRPRRDARAHARGAAPHPRRPRPRRPAQAGAALVSPLRTRACELFGVELPIVQTGMGWVAGPRLCAATSAAGGLGILAAATTVTLPQLPPAIADAKRRPARPFGVNLRPDQPDVAARVAAIIDGGVRVASFAAAPDRALVDQLRAGGVVTVVTVGARRHAE